MVLHPIKRLLKKHDYRVVVRSKKDSPNSVSASFPERKSYPFCNSFISKYAFKDDNSRSFGVLVSVDDGEENFMVCPRYAVEEFVFSDILKFCDLISYRHDMIHLILDDEEVPKKIFVKYVFSSNLSREEKQKKNNLKIQMN